MEHSTFSPSKHVIGLCGPQFRNGLEQLQRLVIEGAQHGYFELAVTCQVGNGKKRELIIRAGKTYKFTFPEEELPR
jgi:hypothetical protein